MDPFLRILEQRRDDTSQQHEKHRGIGVVTVPLKLEFSSSHDYIAQTERPRRASVVAGEKHLFI
jgi:hypothetical protein